MNQHPSIRRIRTTGFLYVWFAHPPFGIHTTGFFVCVVALYAPRWMFYIYESVPGQRNAGFCAIFLFGQKNLQNKKGALK